MYVSEILGPQRSMAKAVSLGRLVLMLLIQRLNCAIRSCWGGEVMWLGNRDFSRGFTYHTWESWRTGFFHYLKGLRSFLSRRIFFRSTTPIVICGPSYWWKLRSTQVIRSITLWTILLFFMQLQGHRFLQTIIIFILHFPQQILIIRILIFFFLFFSL